MQRGTQSLRQLNAPSCNQTGSASSHLVRNKLDSENALEISTDNRVIDSWETILSHRAHSIYAGR